MSNEALPKWVVAALPTISEDQFKKIQSVLRRDADKKYATAVALYLSSKDRHDDQAKYRHAVSQAFGLETEVFETIVAYVVRSQNDQES